MTDRHRLGNLGARTALCLIALVLFVIQTVGFANMISTTTTTSPAMTRVTTTLTETTTATSSALGSRGLLILVVLLAAGASIAVVGGYVWGKKRARKALLGAPG